MANCFSAHSENYTPYGVEIQLEICYSFFFFAQIGFPFAQKIFHVKVLAIGRLTPKNTAIKSQLNKSPSSKFKHTHAHTKFMENNEQKKNNRFRCEPVYDFIDGACHFIVGVDFLYVLEPTIKYNNYK